MCLMARTMKKKTTACSSSPNDVGQPSLEATHLPKMAAVHLYTRGDATITKTRE